MSTEAITIPVVETDDKYLSLEQAQKRFGVSRSTLWRWQKKLGLPVGYTLGKAFYRVTDIHRIIENGFHGRSS